MGPISSGGKALFLVACLTVLLSGVGLFVLLRPTPQPGADQEDDPSRPGFHERGQQSGIDFRMAFLPREQGEKFKVNLYDHGCGVAIADFNGDGHDDVYFVNQLGANALYRNKGDGTFEDVTQKAGVALSDRVCVAATFADYDNDGDQDLFVTSTRGGNVLFRNNGNGTFSDVTKEAGLSCVAHSQTAAFFDYDNDGYLDLFVTNTARWTLDSYERAEHYFAGPADFWKMALSQREHNLLYHNNGDGTFSDVTEQAGVRGEGWGGDVAVFDYNRDGWPDLFVTNMFGSSQLYRNNGKGKKGVTFSNVTREVLGRTSWGAIGCKAFDFNNDGRLDLFIADMHSDMWLQPSIAPDPTLGPPYDFKKKFPHVTGPSYDLSAEEHENEKILEDLFKIRYDEVLFGNTLFKQLPSGKFAEMSDKAGVETFWPWGVATGDFDNDGYQDIFLPSGMGYPYGYWPNALLMNNGNETFTNRAADLGIEPPPGGHFLPQKIGSKQAARSSRCAAVADFDDDGRLDLVVNNFNDRAFYFRNGFPQKNYIAFRLQGSKSNRDAIGALVTVHVGKEVMVRQVQAAGGYLSQSSKTVHFGLGEHAKVERVEIRWPSGIKETIEQPDINMLHPRTEPAQ